MGSLGRRWLNFIISWKCFKSVMKTKSNKSYILSVAGVDIKAQQTQSKYTLMDSRLVIQKTWKNKKRLAILEQMTLASFVPPACYRNNSLHKHQPGTKLSSHIWKWMIGVGYSGTFDEINRHVQPLPEGEVPDYASPGHNLPQQEVWWSTAVANTEEAYCWGNWRCCCLSSAFFLLAQKVKFLF